MKMSCYIKNSYRYVIAVAVSFYPENMDESERFYSTAACSGR